MPIMSFSISEELKALIQRLVASKKDIKNQSGFVRSALNHYIKTAEVSIEDDSYDSEDYAISGHVFLSFERGDGEEETLAKIYEAETDFEDNIKTCQLITCDGKSVTCSYSFRGNVFAFRAFIDKLDSIIEVKQLRYIIN